MTFRHGVPGGAHGGPRPRDDGARRRQGSHHDILLMRRGRNSSGPFWHSGAGGAGEGAKGRRRLSNQRGRTDAEKRAINAWMNCVVFNIHGLVEVHALSSDRQESVSPSKAPPRPRPHAAPPAASESEPACPPPRSPRISNPGHNTQMVLG